MSFTAGSTSATTEGVRGAIGGLRWAARWTFFPRNAFRQNAIVLRILLSRPSCVPGRTGTGDQGSVESGSLDGLPGASGRRERATDGRPEYVASSPASPAAAGAHSS